MLLRLQDRTIAYVALHLTLREHIALSQTCQRLRTLALGKPELWAKVGVGPLPKLSYAHGSLSDRTNNWSGVLAVIRRSYPQPSAVSVVCNVAEFQASNPLEEVLALVGTLKVMPYCIAHTHPLGNNGVSDVPSPPRLGAWRLFASSLCVPAPHLVTFELSVPDMLLAPAGSIVLPSDIFAGEPGQLNSCRLHKATLPPSGCNAFRSLTLFEYQPRVRVMSAAEIQTILSWMPQLKTLGLSFSAEEFQTLDQVARHDHLTCIALILHHSADHFDQILGFFRMCAENASLVADLRTIPYLPPPWGTTKLLPANSGSPHKAESSPNSSIIHYHQFTIVVTSSVTTRELLAGPNTCMHLAHLTIPAQFWDTNMLALRIPLLRHLHILLPICSSLTESGRVREFPGIFVRDLSQKRFVCPALEELHLSPPRSQNLSFCFTTYSTGNPSFSCACRNGYTISLEEVAVFVKEALQFDAPQLRRIALSGVVHIRDADPAAAFIALQGLTEELTVEASVPRAFTNIEILSAERFVSDFGPIHLLTRGLPEDDLGWGSYSADYHIDAFPRSPA